MNDNFSHSEENYLKSIYQLELSYSKVSTNLLAEKLNARPASITDMMKKLSAKKLLHYKPYYGFHLTTEGKKIAIGVIRRHRLWEYFLAQKLGFDWNEVHNLAEELEHVSSKKLIDKLDEYLGFPEHDPHGDPIPDSRGRIKTIDKIPLSELPENQAAEICQVSIQSEEMLDILKHKQIEIGTKVIIKKRFPFDGSLEIRTRQFTFSISQDLTMSLYVKK